MHETIVFILVVGLGSTLILDGWVALLDRYAGLPATNWGMAGRWLAGFARGRLVLDPASRAPPSKAEYALGWAFHYAVGLGYAALLPTIWGADIVAAPEIMPFLVIGFLASSLAGLLVFMPGMGAGIFASKLPNQRQKIMTMSVAHAVFAAAQFGIALLLAA